jgi:prolyl-tRNA synthetase
LPPRIAPYQVVITPIWKSEEEKDLVFSFAKQVEEQLRAADVRFHVDTREGLSPGFKFNDWEMRGVPVRLEIGPRDVESQSVVAARRDVGGKEGKQSIPLDAVAARIPESLDEIQASLLQQATEFRDEHLHEASSYDELKEQVADGWSLIWHCGTRECEDRIKEETKASSRNFPLDLNEEWNPAGKTCDVCGAPAFGRAYFSRAY